VSRIAIFSRARRRASVIDAACFVNRGGDGRSAVVSQFEL
jgi:hypothetical protein